MAETDVAQLQLLQQNVQNILLQKQQFQKQLSEIESALAEIGKTEKIYKIIGNLMVSSEKNAVETELKEKKEMLDLRIKNFDKQEVKIKEKTEELQKKVLGEMKDKK